jgi:uncharacterized protein (DUF362 family)
MCASSGNLTRRQFAAQAGLALAGFAVAGGGRRAQEEVRSAVSLVRSKDRVAGLSSAFELLGKMDFAGKDLYLKANYNSVDPFPATTHPDTLTSVVGLLRQGHCGALTLVERSGMGVTRNVWEALGVPEIAQKLGIRLLALEDLPDDQWRKADLPGTNWKSGIEIPKFLDGDAYLIQICNLKTHRFGGIFSASLKNSVGLIAKYGVVNREYNYMKELHASAQQASMIAEVNLVYEPKLVFMDAMRVFISGGPEAGETADPEVVMASSDRVALDAAGIGLLRLQRDIPEQPIYKRTVYEQEQLKRAVELKLGAKSAEEIQFLTADTSSSMLASQIEAILQQVPPPKK